jgi:hypothetical protein
MKWLEIGLGISILVAMTVSIIFFPKFQYLIVLTAGITANIYFLLSFALFNNIRIDKILKGGFLQGLNQLRLIGSIFTGFILSIICVGIIFKFQSYPQPNFILGLGIFGLIISLIISIIKFRKTNSSFYKNVFIRILFYGIIGFILLIFPREKMLEIKYRKFPSYIEAAKKSMADPQNEDLWKKAEEERQKIYEQN